MQSRRQNYGGEGRNSGMFYQVIQAGYWLSLSVWFGGVVFVAMAAGAIFRVLREQEPVLPQVLSVNLEGQHGTLLGSTIMTQVLKAIGPVQGVCAVVVLACSGAQFLVADTTGQNLLAAALRSAIAAVAAAVMAYDRFVVLPRLATQRQKYLDHADEPETANPAKDAFDRDQQLSLTLLMLVACLLAGLVLFSAAITPAPEFKPLARSAGL